MAQKSQLLDRWGNPVERQTLTRESVAMVRSPLTSYPADAMDPIRLAQILRGADMGDAIRYFELAEQIEERDLHYLGVLSTRKRSVSQIEVTVEAASDSAQDVAIADMVREWVDRDELSNDLFHILDAIGKGISFTRIDWEVSEGQWRPKELEWEDPRNFRFDRERLKRPMMIDQGGREVPLEPYRYIYANMAAKSGLPLRSGLGRIAAWGWMFKSFTLRDWSIFSQTYGQPIRLGRWHSGASESEKDMLYQAVVNIAGDCAAIIPESMKLEFVESKTIGASADLFERRADWLDRQTSKAVLGQTATTDAIAGGHAVGQEHREVQEDIETADAKSLSSILNQDLVRPWVELERGPQRRYPRLRIARPKAEDIKGMSEALQKLVPLGLQVEESQVRDKLGFSDPAKGARILTPSIWTQQPSETPPAAPAPAAPGRGRLLNGVSGVFEGGAGLPGVSAALQAQAASVGVSGGGDPVGVLADRLEVEARPAVEAMIAQIEVMLQAATSLDEFHDMLLTAFPKIDSAGFAAAIASGLIVADLAGRAAIAGEDGNA